MSAAFALLLALLLFEGAQLRTPPPPPCDAAVEAAARRGAEGDRAEAMALAEEALRRCPDHASLLWELLGTLRYLDDDPAGALRAWNRAGRPRITEVAPGLPLDARALGLEPGSLLTPGRLDRARTRLEALPTVARARVDYRPVEGGGARVEGAVTRHPPHTLGRGDLPAHGLRALGGRLELSASDRLGSGERAVLSGLVDRGFREGALHVKHPVPGAPAAVAAWEVRHQVVRPVAGAGVGAGERLARTGVRAGFRPPPGGLGPFGARLEGWIGLDRWVGPDGVETGPGAGLRARLDGPAGLALVAHASRWRGGAGAGELGLEVHPAPGWAGIELRAAGSLLARSEAAPADLAPRFGGGPAATHLARGAPGGTMTLLPPGRHWLHGTAELSRLWPTRGGVALGAAFFVDGVHGLERVPTAWPGGAGAGEPRGALHPGIGLRAGLPGVDGRLRVDLALDPRAERLRVSVGW